MCASFLLSSIFGESAYLVKVCSGKSVSVCLLPNLQLFLNNWGFYCTTHSATGRYLCCFVDCICLILAFWTAFKGKDRVLQLVMVWSGSSLCCICQGIESEGTLGYCVPVWLQQLCFWLIIVQRWRELCLVCARLVTCYAVTKCAAFQKVLSWVCCCWCLWQPLPIEGK